jgi:purine-binding chemotaxis protein CheW
MPEVAANRTRSSGTRRFLTFHSGTESYALPVENVTEVITLPPVSRLPQSPPALLGMANLRGSVIAVASLRAMLGQGSGPPSARAILLGGAAPVAICVDSVDGLVSLDAAQIETRQAELVTHPGERLCGAFQPASGGEVTKILDIQPLLTMAFTPASPRAPRTGRRTVSTRQEQTLPQSQEVVQLLLSFEVAGQEYALPLQEVEEIIPLPPAIAKVPRSEALLLGIVTLRGALLPLLSLRGLLGFPLHDNLRQTKIVVTSVAGVPAGLVADGTRVIIQAEPGTIQPAPAMLAARMGGETRVQSIYRNVSDGRVVPVIKTGSLFGEEVMSRLANAMQQLDAEPAETGNPLGPTRQFLVFSLGDEEFGLPIAAVDEVAAAPEKITRLPKTPKFLEGVVNLRGDVLPVIDQRRRFDMPDYAGQAGRQRLVVARTQRHRAGLRVDGVAGILTVAEDHIESAPAMNGETTSLVSGVINLPAAGRMVLLLNPDELLSRAERGLLDNFTAAQKQGD